MHIQYFLEFSILVQTLPLTCACFLFPRVLISAVRHMTQNVFPAGWSFNVYRFGHFRASVREHGPCQSV